MGHMPPEQWTELGQTIEFTFQRKALRIAFNSTPKLYHIAPRCEPVQCTLLIKEVIGMAFNVPSPLDPQFYIPFNHFNVVIFGNFVANTFLYC